MMCEHKDRGVERRIVAPPPLPDVIGPRSTNWSKHVSSQDPCADIGKTSCREVVIDARCATLAAVHPLERTGRENPIVQGDAADSNWISEVLVRACAVAIDGNGETMHAHPAHEGLLITKYSYVCSCT